MRESGRTFNIKQVEVIEIDTRRQRYHFVEYFRVLSMIDYTLSTKKQFLLNFRKLSRRNKTK